MSLKGSSLLCLALLLALSLSPTCHAFNITRLLGQYPNLAMFNQYLTETKLADQINSRQTITVLAVDNGALSSISGKTKDVIKAIISTHVILDYYDEKKLVSIQGGNTQLTTLYQASGLANNLQGFINVGIIGEGEIAFGSAVQGAPLNAELVRTVTTQPYNISVLQVTEPIIAPGIDAQSPGPASGAKTPLPSKTPAPVAKTPVPSKTPPKTPAPVSGDSVAESPEEAAAPEDSTGKTPTSAPTPTPASAPGPAKEEKAADENADAPAPSSSSRIAITRMGLVGTVTMVLASLLVAL